MIEVPTYTAQIYIGGDVQAATQFCQRHVMDVGLCVTVEPVEFVYTGGREGGVRVGLINYARFPTEPVDIFARALNLARLLRAELAQHSFSIVATDKTVFETVRSEAPSSLTPTPQDEGRSPSAPEAPADPKGLPHA
jgi:hypothetical protein